MAKVVKTPEKKAPKAKAAPRKRNLNKGQAMACEVCGMAVTIDQIGDEMVEEDTILLCCGEPMKEKATAKKPVKAAAKTPAKK
jgi:hypothetical protein